MRSRLSQRSSSRLIFVVLWSLLMRWHAKIAKTLTCAGAEYLLAVKGNQGKLEQDIQDAFKPCRQVPLTSEQCQTEKHHGRLESRTCHVLCAKKLDGDFSAWDGLKSIVMVENFRAQKGKAAEIERRYNISAKELTAEQASQAIRAHWGIESMHWILDVSLQKDACQIYRKNAAENLAVLRHMALNMTRAESTKISVPMKQKRCMMNPVFLERILLAGFTSLLD